VGPPKKGKEGGEGKRREERGGEGVPECPNPELASLILNVSPTSTIWLSLYCPFKSSD